MLLGCALLLWAMDVGVHEDIVSHLFADALTAEEHFILVELRIPRILLAFGAGAVLSLVGLSYQTFFSNPLASPYTLGVSGCAAVGYVASRFLFPDFGVGTVGMLSAIVGGSIALVVLLPFLQRGQTGATGVVLLLGVLLSLLCGSILFLIQYFLDPSGIVALTSWYFGSLSITGIAKPLVLFLFGIFFCLLAMWLAPALDLLLLGEEYAYGMGIRVRSVQVSVIGLATLLVAFTVSLCGPIGFIGLVIPHFGRVVVGHSHIRLVPASFFAGGFFLLFCDTIARFIGGMQEIPVGLITAIIGCPVMGALLIQRGR
jgi:iron complex transport system permease protein